MNDLDRVVAHVAGNQHALLSRAQAVDLGCTPDGIKHRLRAGRWHALHPGVYLINGAAVTPRTHTMAACLATGGVASHRTAAGLLEVLDLDDDIIEISVDRRVRAAPDGVVVHRSCDYQLIQPIFIDGVPTTPPARLATDLGAVVKPQFRYERAIEDLIARGLLTWPEALDARLMHGKQGRNGVGPLRDLLIEKYGRHIPHSKLERAFLDLLRYRDVPEPVPQFVVADESGFVARVDFAYPDRKVLIEMDSWRFHSDRSTFERDREKRARLVAQGWTVLAFTWQMVIHDPDAVIRALRRVLGRFKGVEHP